MQPARNQGNESVLPRKRPARLRSWRPDDTAEHRIAPPLEEAIMSTPRHLIDALESLSSAVIEATGSWAFLASERIQLIDAAHKAAWLLVRVNRNEALIARNPDLAQVIRSTYAATHALHGVRRLGQGSEALTDLLTLLVRVDDLLPVSAQIYQ